MTISYTLQPQPIWIFNDLTGKAAAGGKLYTKSSLNPTQFKDVYQSPSNSSPWTNPIVFNAAGMAPGPIFWKLDSTNANDLYYVEFYDANDNLIWSENYYPISAGGGGGGGVTLVEKIDNILTNSSFTQNIGATVTSPIADQTLLAPGAHSGLAFPDIRFIRSGTASGTDSISFIPFTSDPGIGINPIAPDYLTYYYMRYACTVAGAETSKGIQIPISKYVNNLSGKLLTLTFYARHSGGTQNQLNFNVLQYFGSGGSPSAPVVTPLVQPKNLTGSFAFYTVNVNIPSVLGKTLGETDDDGTYLQILFQTGGTTQIDIFKPMLFVGDQYPTVIYESNEENEVEINLPRTGDVKISANAFSNNASQAFQNGWIPLNDGTIGSPASNATTRNKADTWLLYKLIWENTVSADCPIYTSTGVLTTKGGSAVTDWNANKAIKLPSTYGRVIAGRGTGPNALANAYGESTHQLTVAEMPSHDHPGSSFVQWIGGGATPGRVIVTQGSTALSGYPVSVASQGGGAAHNNIQPTVNYNMLIKL